MSSDRTVTTVLLVDSADIAGSIGRNGYLRDHLKPLNDSNLDVEITRTTAGRCDIVAQRVAGTHGRPGDVPQGLEDWYATMTEPIEILDTTSLFILSLADAVNREVFRHRATDELVQPPPGYRESWTGDQSAWLDREFEPAAPTREHIAQALAFIAHTLDRYTPGRRRCTTVATLTRWHVAPGGTVANGDTLFDLRFSTVSSRLESRHRETDKTIDISVVAGRSGYVDSVSGAVGAELPVGTRVGVITTTPQAHWDDIDTTPRFPVGVRVTARDDE